MLAAFLLAALIEGLIFVQHPIVGAVLPLVLIVSLLVLQLDWLRAWHLLGYTTIAAYLVDVLAALTPGGVWLATILALSLAIALRRQGILNPVLRIPLALAVYYLVLWLIHGAPINLPTGQIMTVNLLVAGVVYSGFYLGAKRLEARL